MRKIISIICFLLLAGTSYAQDFTLSGEAPRVVAVGETFRVEFAMNAKPENFTAPLFEGFDVLAGPSVSQSTNISIANGKSTRVSSYTYSYVIVALKEGNITIGESSASYDGKIYKSKKIPIEVIKQGATSGGDSSQGGGDKPASTFNEGDVLLLMEVDKKSAYKGESVLATLKLLTRVNVVGIESVKMPSFAGFWNQELDIKDDKRTQFTRETYKDKIYDVAVLKEFLLFPQQNNEIVIEPMSLNAVIRIVDNSARSNSIFDSMFGGGGGYRDIRRSLVTQPVKLKIKEFPSEQPISFNGAVGEFTMASELSSDILVANSASNLIVQIKGNGNIPLISEPDVELPSSFELYKIKADEKIYVSNKGVNGSKTYTFPFIARAMGSYTLEPVKFTFFNPRTAKFVTLNSENFKIAVSSDTTSNSAGGTSKIISGVTKEELQILGSDIRYIMSGVPVLKRTNEFFIWSTGYFVTSILLIIIFVLTLLFLKKYIKESKDMILVKSRRANKAALNRLKEAKLFLDNSNSASFYDAVLKSMWGYVADKLNIDKASLSRDNVGDELLKKDISEDEKEQFLSVIASCEEARYSPVASSMMSEVYNSAMEVITKFENKL